MRQGSLISGLVIIVESLYKGRMKAIRFGGVESGSQDQTTADGTNACMQCTVQVVLNPSKIDQQRCVLPGLVIRAEQSLVYKPS